MIEDVNEAIKKNLPAQVSEVLQERLKQGERAIRDLKDAEEIIQNLRKNVDRLVRLEDMECELESGKRQLESAKQKFEVEKRDCEIKLLKEKYQDVKSLMHDVFRNQRIVYRKTEDESRNWTDNTGMSHYDNTSRTTETEKSEE